MFNCESFSLRRHYPGNSRHKSQFYSFSTSESTGNCKEKYPQGNDSPLPGNLILHNSVYERQIPAPILLPTADTKVTLPICTSLILNFPAAHGLGATRSYFPWLSTHAPLVSFFLAPALLNLFTHLRTYITTPINCTPGSTTWEVIPVNRTPGGFYCYINILIKKRRP
jgi:hypothetical protein